MFQAANRVTKHSSRRAGLKSGFGVRGKVGRESAGDEETAVPYKP